MFLLDKDFSRYIKSTDVLYLKGGRSCSNLTLNSIVICCSDLVEAMGLTFILLILEEKLIKNFPDMYKNVETIKMLQTISDLLKLEFSGKPLCDSIDEVGERE